MNWKIAQFPFFSECNRLVPGRWTSLIITFTVKGTVVSRRKKKDDGGRFCCLASIGHGELSRAIFLLFLHCNNTEKNDEDIFFHFFFFHSLLEEGVTKGGSFSCLDFVSILFAAGGKIPSFDARGCTTMMLHKR